METNDLFTTALQLTDPWYVEKVEFLPDEKKPEELHISINFRRGATFYFYKDSEDEASIVVDENGTPVEFKANDTVERTWRHLNFFQYKTYIHARVPKIRTGKGKGTSATVRVPWARPGSGFTLLFEAWVLELAKHVPPAAIARIVDEHDTRLWRFINHYVEVARERVDESEVENIGMDETSKKGHNYITIVVDLDTHNVLYVTDGKDATTIDRYAEDMKTHNGNPDNIKIVTCDMALGFKAATEKNFINSTQVIDKFHVIKNANEAVNDVRKAEAKENSLLNRTQYIWLKNDDNLTEKQKALKISLSKKHLKTSRACSMREELQDIYNTASNREEAEIAFKKLCSWMMHSRLDRMKAFCGTIKDHWDSILSYFDHRYTNAILEGTNSVVQKIKERSRGFRNVEYFKTLIYLVCGGLDIDGVIDDIASSAISAV